MRNLLHREKKRFLLLISLVLIILLSLNVLAGGGGSSGCKTCSNGQFSFEYMIYDISSDKEGNNVVVPYNEVPSDTFLPDDPTATINPDKVTYTIPYDQKKAICENVENRAYINLKYKIKACDSGSCKWDIKELTNLGTDSGLILDKLPEWDKNEGYCLCSGNQYINSYTDHGCCGDDSTDFGSGPDNSNYVCLYNPETDNGEWYLSTGNMASTFEVTNKDGTYSYSVLATSDGWYACDIDDGFENFITYDTTDSHKFTYSEISRVSIGDYLEYDYICYKGGTVDQEVDPTSTITIIPDSNEQWAKCDFSEYNQNSHEWNLDKGSDNVTSDDKIYYCADLNKWVSDLDEVTDYPEIKGCEAAAFYLEGEKYLDYGATQKACCGDGLVNSEDDDGENKYEFYNGIGSSQNIRLKQADQYYAAVGGCWNNHKIAHGQFLEDVIGAREGHNLILNPIEITQEDIDSGNPEIKFWDIVEEDVFSVRKGTEPGIASKGLIIDSGLNYIETKYWIPVTNGLTYTLSYNAIKLEEMDYNFNIKIINEDDSSVDYPISFDSDWNPVPEEITFKAKSDKIKVRFESGDERFMLVSVNLKPEENRILNDNGTFYSCNGIFEKDDFATIQDPICSGHDFSTLNNPREFFCDFNGQYSDEKMPILSSISNKISLGTVTGEDLISERTNLAIGINLFINSGFELDEANLGTCSLLDSNIDGFQSVNTKDLLRNGFSGNDWYGTKYLDCTSGTYSRTLDITSETAGDYIFSAWIKGNIDITLGSTTNSFYSDDWTRIYFSSSLLPGIQNIIFTGGYIDDVQIEKAGQIGGVTQSYPSKYFYTEEKQGCCSPEYCWSGKYCIPDSLIPPNPNSVWTTSNLFPGETGYACLDGEWAFTRKKFNWNDDPASVGFCNLDTECFVSESEGCISSGETKGAYLCENGNWTSKTKYLAAALLDLASGSLDYSLICGNYEDVLVDTNYPVDLQYAKNILDGLGTCNGEGTDNKCTNDFCVLKYGTEVAFGVSLNQFIGETNGYDFMQLLGNFDCDELSTMDVLANEWAGFRSCTNTNLYYDYNKKMLIFNPSGITGLKSLTGLDSTSPLYNLAKTLIYDKAHEVVNELFSRDIVPGPIIVQSSESLMNPENWEMFSRINLFNDLYVAKHGTKEIFAVKEIKYNHDASRMETDRNAIETFLMTFKDDKTSRDICETFHQYELSFKPIVIAGTNCTYIPESNTYTLISRDVVGDDSKRASIAWKKFTGWLRFD